MKSIRQRQCKFGHALVIETFARSGGYILGFRIDPIDQLEQVLKQITNLHTVYASNPNFGVDFTIESDAPVINAVMQPRIEEDVELIDDEEYTHAIAAYYCNGDNTDGDGVAEIQYDPRLGLAVEALKPGLTIEHLWRVI